MNKQTFEYLKNTLRNFDTNEVGLFTGKAGTCLALYVISKKSGDKELEEKADALLNDTLEAASKITDLSIDKGLTGIGLAIIFLASNGYVEGELDEVLGDIDALLYKKLKDDKIKFGIGCTSGLIGFLIYLVERLSHSEDRNSLSYQLNVSSLRTVINKIEEILPNHFYDMVRDIYTSLISNYPILFVYLKKAIDIEVYKDKIHYMMEYWGTYFMSYIPYYNINKLYMAVTLAYINKSIAVRSIEKYIQQLLFSIDLDGLYKELDVKVMNMNEGFFFAEVLLWAAEKLFSGTEFSDSCRSMRSKIQRNYNPLYAESIRNATSQDNKLDLINSFVGVETANILYPFIFDIDD